jgi:hypothetical protein
MNRYCVVVGNQVVKSVDDLTGEVAYRHWSDDDETWTSTEVEAAELADRLGGHAEKFEG